ncbi:hypothetical protein DFJ58DRAFT_838656 [Suillus subalutaceus]|uniref:uncharacterized protein n=1 Tax=Suillus subalutaceus TaxID=48586 RepID=UPI001B875BC2|nr:uncharacterized protein DFJ58DRAFT_838656 [Suillus subalutaceus]KAG1865550.1 hypothetical protein DFJ58DRAFT_838656 [Suillus subalutaceus]
MDAEAQYIRIEINGRLKEYEIGEERFRAVAKTSYRGIGGNVMVYDVTNQTTFDSEIIVGHLDRSPYSDRYPMKFLGNKADGSDSRIVVEEQGEALADQLGIKLWRLIRTRA